MVFKTYKIGVNYFQELCVMLSVFILFAGKENILVKQAHSLDSDHVSFVLVSFY